MSIDITAKLLYSMQEELKEMSRRNVFAREGSLKGSEEKAQQKEAEAMEKDSLILLSLIRNIEAKLVAELEGKVLLLSLFHDRKRLRVRVPTRTVFLRRVASISKQDQR